MCNVHQLIALNYLENFFSIPQYKCYFNEKVSLILRPNTVDFYFILKSAAKRCSVSAVYYSFEISFPSPGDLNSNF